MDKPEYCPKIGQSIKLLLMYTFVFEFISITGFTLFSSIFGFSQEDLLVSSIVSIIKLALLILWINRKNKVCLNKIFSLEPPFINYIAPMIFIVLGSAIVLSEFDNLLRTFLPMNDFWFNMFENFNNQCGLWKSVVSVALVAPIIEEILFRGIILRGFTKHYSIKKSIIASALLFGLMHMNPWQFLGAFVWGIVSGWWFIKTRSLIPCILGHVLNNSLSFIVINLLGLEISGYSSSFTEVNFQPIWFDILGTILLVVGFIWLSKKFSDIDYKVKGKILK